MKGFEDFYGANNLQSEVPQVKFSGDDLKTLSKEIDFNMPDYMKAIIIIANKVAALDAAISMLAHRQPFAPLTGIISEMGNAIEQLTSDCTSLFEFANANYVLEVLDPDFSKTQDNEEA